MCQLHVSLVRYLPCIKYGGVVIFMHVVLACVDVNNWGEPERATLIVSTRKSLYLCLCVCVCVSTIRRPRDLHVRASCACSPAINSSSK